MDRRYSARELKSGVIPQMLDIGETPGDEAVDYEDSPAVGEQGIGEMRS